MWRWILFLLGLCITVLCVVWFVKNPGDVTLRWQDHRVDTSVGVLILAAALLSAVVAVIYRGWRFLRRAPGELGAAMRGRKQRKGYSALGSGMVAVAAGDASEARRHARRAEALLDDSTPLTRLLSAQSAQLDGDERAAEKFFAEMLEDPETRFLGLRGLLTQALKAEDKEKALELAKQAYALQPKSEWVAATLFELQSGAENWLEAQSTNDQMVKARLLEKGDGDRRRAVIALAKARNGTNGAENLKNLKLASELAPDLIPAVSDYAGRLIADGKNRKAVTLLEKTWAKTPHQDLIELYWSAKNADQALQRVKASERLASLNTGSIESHLVLARAALDAQLWGEARKHLRDAGAGDGLEPPGRVCRMMAELEERENDDLSKAREWLLRAASAPSDHAWVCGTCGNAVQEWSPHCGNCGTFDGYSWSEPKHVPALAKPEEPEEAETPALPQTVPDTEAVPAVRS